MSGNFVRERQRIVYIYNIHIIYVYYIYYICILYMYIIYVYYICILYILYMYIIYVYYICILYMYIIYVYIIYVYYICKQYVAARARNFQTFLGRLWSQRKIQQNVEKLCEFYPIFSIVFDQKSDRQFSNIIRVYL